MLPTTLRISMAAIAAVAIALAGTAQAQEMPPDGQPPETQPPGETPPEGPPPEGEIPGMGPIHPLVVLHAINQIQSQLGLMGVNEAVNGDIQEFAGDLAQRHGSFDRRLLETANELDVDVAGSGQVRIAMEERLQNLDPQLHMLMEATPQAFDAAFLNLVVTSQQDAIETVQQLQSETGDEEVQALLSDALDGYRAHLERARELQDELGQPGAGAAP